MHLMHAYRYVIQDRIVLDTFNCIVLLSRVLLSRVLLSRDLIFYAHSNFLLLFCIDRHVWRAD